MKKERIKNTILILLIISSLVLTCQIWFNEKLLPDGYNFFADIRIFDKIAGFFGVSDTDADQLQTSIVSPSYLAGYTVRDFDHIITVLNESSEHYQMINDFVTATLTHSLAAEAKHITRVDEAAWQRALFTRGFYVDYGIVYNTSTFSQLLGVSSPAFGELVANVSRFIITAEDSLVSDISVFAIDESNNSYYKISTDLKKDDFSSSIALLSEQGSAKKRFSFFINADVATGTAGEAVFAPYIILDEAESEHADITSTNPLVRDNSLSSHAADKILRAFSINPKTAGKSTDAYDNTIFVQSRATLKITTDGLVLYTAAAGTKGLALPNYNANTAQTLTNAVKLLNQVSSSLLEADKTKLYMSGLEEENGNLKVSFDYMYNGMPVVLCGVYEGTHAVTMEFENGYLKSYTQLLRRYEDCEGMTVLPSTYNAVNSIFSSLSPNERANRIEKMFIAYADDGQGGKRTPSWFLKLENTEGFKTEIQ